MDTGRSDTEIKQNNISYRWIEWSYLVRSNHGQK